MNDHAVEAAGVTAFYDALAPDYDLMTDLAKRFVQERPFFRLLVERYGLRTALDAGCGTGFHSLLLSQLGVKVTAVDIAGVMLERLKAHAAEMGLNIETVRADFLELPGLVRGEFDALFVMGNSLAHLVTDDAVRRALANFHRLLRPGGMVFIQLLNYHRILRNRERIQSVRESGGKTFVRFYDYNDRMLTFNLLTVDASGGTSRQRLESIPLRALLPEEVDGFVREAGFIDGRTFGGINMGKFEPDESRDLVLVAHRPPGPQNSR